MESGLWSRSRRGARADMEEDDPLLVALALDEETQEGALSFNMN